MIRRKKEGDRGIGRKRARGRERERERERKRIIGRKERVGEGEIYGKPFCSPIAIAII